MNVIQEIAEMHEAIEEDDRIISEGENKSLKAEIHALRVTLRYIQLKDTKIECWASTEDYERRNQIIQAVTTALEV